MRLRMLSQTGSTIKKKKRRTKLKQPKKQTDNTESEISLFFSRFFLAYTRYLRLVVNDFTLHEFWLLCGTGSNCAICCSINHILKSVILSCKSKLINL